MYHVLWHRKGLRIWFWPGPVFGESAWEEHVERSGAGGGWQGGGQVGAL